MLNREKLKKYLPAIITIFIIVLVGLVYFFMFAAAPSNTKMSDEFINPNAPKNGQIAIEGYGIPRLKAEGFIKSELGFKIAFALAGGKDIQPGAYQIKDHTNAWQVAQILKAGPNMKWVTIPEGLRKEQIANILGDALGWSDDQKSKWVTNYTALTVDYIEGVYFPDTYLIPVNENPLDVAQRMERNFNEKFAPYSQEALKQNIKWTTVIRLASIVQREAADSNDMPLIAGVFWNRLNQDMKLEADSTVQYARDSLAHYGKEPGLYQDLYYTLPGDWWKPIQPADKQIKSPFNTYLNKGLPPRPIDNPGLDAISAVLHPSDTPCLYYLHDDNRQIHCAKTYEEHLKNISQYLKN